MLPCPKAHLKASQAIQSVSNTECPGLSCDPARGHPQLPREHVSKARESSFFRSARARGKAAGASARGTFSSGNSRARRPFTGWTRCSVPIPLRPRPPGSPAHCAPSPQHVPLAPAPPPAGALGTHLSTALPLKWRLNRRRPGGGEGRDSNPLVIGDLAFFNLVFPQTQEIEGRAIDDAARSPGTRQG